MTGDDKGTKVRILDKEFRVNCPKDKEHALFEAAAYLDNQMRTIKASGRVIGIERIAIMAALNIAHELTTLKHSGHEGEPAIQQRLQALHHKIDNALSESHEAYDKIDEDREFERTAPSLESYAD